jgi:hypothetical protein
MARGINEIKLLLSYANNRFFNQANLSLLFSFNQHRNIKKYAEIRIESSAMIRQTRNQGNQERCYKPKVTQGSGRAVKPP